MVKIVQNYTLHEQIGQGQYGKVYKGIDTRTNKDVAAKVIQVKKFKQNPKLEECTLNEIEVLSKIDCPHIVKFIQILKTANNFYFFYQFCNQGTLEDEIKSQGVLPEHQVLSYLHQILEAFKILSFKNIMHRDLKPSNILLHNGEIKIGDFGFCKSLQNQRDLAQTMLGSPIYMAPEVLRGQIYTIKADIWSLGVVIYEMVYGFCPYEESSIARLINLLEHQELQFNPQINAISPILQDLIRKMLVKDHFKRVSWEEVLHYHQQLLHCQDHSLRRLDINEPQLLHPSNQPKLLDLNHKYQKQSSQSFAKRKDLSPNLINNKENNAPKEYRMFKKKSENVQPLAILNTTTTASIQNQDFFLKEKAKQKQNDKNIREGQNWSAYKVHEKLFSFIKIVHTFIEDNLQEELTCQLAIKFYQLILKQHYKLQSYREYTIERAELNEALKVLQEIELLDHSNKNAMAEGSKNTMVEGSKNTMVDSKCSSENSNGPLLSKYIRHIQLKYPSEFIIATASYNHSNHHLGKANHQSMLIKCLHLLDFNEIATIHLTNYQNLTKTALLQEFQQKLIRNII